MKENRTLIKGFQGLRGFAILLIMISHCNLITNSYGNNVLTYAGAWGVTCFIMLSGFLAVDRYYRTEFHFSDSLRIIKHKIKKCYPMHLLTFLIALPLAYPGFRQSAVKALCKAVFNLTLTQTIVPISDVYFSFNAVSWYLSLDIILVLFLPFVLILITKMSPKMIINAVIVIFIFQIVISVITSRFHISHWISYICPVTRGLDYFAGGGVYLLAKKSSALDNRKYKWMIYGSLILESLILIVSMPLENTLFCAASWTIPTAALVFSIYKTENNENTLFQCKPLVWIGNISFELFLGHQLIVRYCSSIISRLGMQITCWMYILMILLSIAIAFMCSQRRKFIDRIKNE